MSVTVAKWGDSLAIRIPQAIAQQIQLAEGSEGLEDLLSLLIVGGLSAHTMLRQSLEQVSFQLNITPD